MLASLNPIKNFHLPPEEIRATITTLQKEHDSMSECNTCFHIPDDELCPWESYIGSNIARCYANKKRTLSMWIIIYKGRLEE